jgi:hypothetical protein
MPSDATAMRRTFPAATFTLGLFLGAAGFGIGISRLLDMLLDALGGDGAISWKQGLQATLVTGGGAMLLLVAHRALVERRSPAQAWIVSLVVIVWAFIGVSLL